MAQKIQHDSQPIPLSFANIGEVVYIHDIQAGRKLRRRLIDLGLLRGVSVRVMQRGMGGPVIIAVNQDSRLALGACMSQKIIVTRQQANEPATTDYPLAGASTLQAIQV